MDSKDDPTRKTFKLNRKEDALCLGCQKIFKSPDKTRIRFCKECKRNRTRSQDYTLPVKQAPHDH